MNLFRYRRPSLNTLLGITKAKKRVTKELGVTEAMKSFRAWTERQTEVQAEDRIRVGGGTADLEWIAEAGRVFGGDSGGGAGFGDNCPGSDEVTAMDFLANTSPHLATGIVGIMHDRSEL